MNHTPTPWRVTTDECDGEPCVAIVAEEGGCTVAVMGDRGLDPDCPVEVDEADANRIVACVNACAGMDDPETTVPELIAVNREAFRLLSNFRRGELPDEDACCDRAGSVLTKIKPNQPQE